jgi:predicted PurR-regulated permease PerM
MSLNIRILLVFVLILTVFVGEYVIAGEGGTQGQDQNALENIKTMKEQITNLENRQKSLETVTSNPIVNILTRIAAYTDAIWLLLVLLLVAFVAAIVLIALVSLWVIPHSINNLISNLTTNFGQASPLNNLATRLQDVATSIGTPLNIVTNQLPVITSNLNTLTTVASELQVIAHNLNTLANNLDTKSHLDNMVTQLQKIAVKP